MNKRFIVGSVAFFNNMPGFHPKDIDVLFLDKNPEDYSVCRQIQLRGKCVFNWRYENKEQLIRDHNEKGMTLGKFLVPEVAAYIGLTIEDLKLIRKDMKVDDKHMYELVIADSYIENGDFSMNEEQLNHAYEEYIKSRQ